MGDHDNCRVEPLEKPVDTAALKDATAAYLAVDGMGCSRCAMRVRNSLLALEGVILADVFLEEGLAAVAFDAGQLQPDRLAHAVAAAGNDGRHHYRAAPLAVKPVAEALAFRGDNRTWF